MYLRSQMLHRSCQINCGRFDIRVPHHLGKAVQVAPAFKHKGRKGMAQHVGIEIDAGGFFEIPDEATQ